jgi:uncharacterized protein with GYD domain
LFDSHAGQRDRAAEAGVVLNHAQQSFGSGDVAVVRNASDDVVVQEIVIVVVVVTNVEEAVTFEPERLMYFEVKTNSFHIFKYSDN